MPGYSDPGFDTLALHAGATPDATGARAVPIHLSTSFVFESSDHAAALFNLERAGHVYSRISNPTNAVFEQRMAALLVFDLPERPRERDLRAMAAAWSPWRSVAARILWAYYKHDKQREGIR